MFIFEVLGAFFAALVFVTLLTQVWYPFVRGTPYFPMLRKDSAFKKEVTAKERELEEQTELVELEIQLQEINRRKAELEKSK